MENRLERRIGKKSRHRGIRNANGTGVGRASGYRRPHRVYNAVVSKSRNKWSRRGTAKKNRGARRPNYPLPAVVVVVVSRGADGFGGGEGGGSPPRRRREVEIKFHVETV